MRRVLFVDYNISNDRHNIIHRPTTPSIISGNALQQSDTLRDLGIVIDCNLKFDKHIAAVVHKVSE